MQPFVCVESKNLDWRRSNGYHYERLRSLLGCGSSALGRRIMSKKLFWIQVSAPTCPRARFLIKSPDVRHEFIDVTDNIAKLVIEDLQNESGYFALLRMNAQDKLIWRTTHPSLQEAKWQLEFEYDLPEEKWIKFADSVA